MDSSCRFDGLADENRIALFKVMNVVEHDGVRRLVIDRDVGVAVASQDAAAQDHTPRKRGAVLGDVGQSRTGSDQIVLALTEAEGREALHLRRVDELDAITAGTGLDREVVRIEGDLDAAARERQILPGVAAGQLLLQLTEELHVTSSQTSDNVTDQLNLPIHETLRKRHLRRA